MRRDRPTRRLTALVSSRTRPPLTVRVHRVPIQGKEVLAIEVPRSRTPVGTADGRYIRRAIGGDGRPTCLPLHFHEMQALQAERGLLDYSALVVPEARWEDLDPLEFERLRRSIRERRGLGDETLLDLPDLELAKAVGAVEANGHVTAVRVLGLLLFGKEEALRRLLPTHEVAFQVLHGQAVEVNDFFRWPLLRVMEEIEARFRVRNGEQELLVGLLPREAFRKAFTSGTFWSPARGRATPCSPTPSSVPASWSVPPAGSTRFSMNSCGTAAQHLPTNGVTRRVWC